MLLNKKLAYSLLLLCFGLLVGCSPSSNEFYVSPQGDDLNSGNRHRPFASLERAKQAAIQHFASKGQEDLTIWLEGGIYEITKPIVFSVQDFPQKEGRLLLKNQGGDPVIISGGMTLNKWEKSADNLWVTTLPDEISINYVRELFIDGRRAPRSRFPNEGYLRVGRTGDDRRTNFYFANGDFPIPNHISDTELILLHDWSMSRIPIQKIDTDSNKLTTVDSIGAKVLDFFKIDNWEAHPRYFLENDLNYIDQDFEWYFDARNRQLYLKLSDDEDISQYDITIPISEGLLQLQGSSEQTLKQIQIEGLSFQYSAWEIPPKGYAGIQAAHFDPRPNTAQAWSIVPAAVSATFTDSCAFRSCTFEKLGGTGLWIGAGCTNTEVFQSQFNDISANGIMIGEGRDRQVGGEAWWRAVPEQVAKDNTVDHCKVENCGVQYYGSVGIWCGLSEATAITNNEVFNLPYTGISIGWMWNPYPTPARENIVNGNHIHHIMQKLSDGGGIYMLGLQPGSQLSNNLIHDVEVNAGKAGSNGMFLDEGITDVVVANNIIYNIAKSPIRFHRATTNLLQENILFCTDGIPAFTYNTTDSTLIRKVDNQIFHQSDEVYDTILQKVVAQWQLEKIKILQKTSVAD